MPGAKRPWKTHPLERLGVRPYHPPLSGARPMQALAKQRISGVLVAIVLLVTMVAPLVAIQVYGDTMQGRGREGAEVTVGIAVILRATARRLLRGASSNLMRTTAGALGRTSARAFVRRIVKFTGRLFFSSMVQQAAEEGEETDEARPATRKSQFVALGVGFVGLCLSFWGILQVTSEEVIAKIMGTAELGTFEVVILAGLPLLAYAGLHQLFGRLVGVGTRYRTEIDGLLLQAYFTGAGSFLPLTTDVDYEGTERGKGLMATVSILGMFVIHLVLVLAGEQLGSDHLVFLGYMFLIYAFVYVFPIKPLEGHFIWSVSRWQWLLITLPILGSFLYWLPSEFGEIL